MDFEGTTYRPPPEADNALLQVTVGCAHNRCTFCDMYRDVRFRSISMDRIESDLKEIDYIFPKVERIFLVNGDAFVLSANKLQKIAEKIKQILPDCRTISMYAAIRNIKSKSTNDLTKLRELGVNDLYVGVESGWDEVIASINKGHTIEEAKIQLQRLTDVGIDFIANVMLGIAGKGKGIENAGYTADLLNQVSPKTIWTGTTVLFEGTELFEENKTGKFQQATELEKLREQQELIELLSVANVRYYGVHPSNMVPVSGMLPDDKQSMIDKIDLGIAHLGIEKLSQVLPRHSL